VLFFDSNWNYLDIIDIFDSLSGMWSSKNLTQSRTAFAWTTMRDIVAFGGGYDGSNPSSVVDLYNSTSNTWLTTNLSQPRYWLASTSPTNKIFFGGGAVFDIVDIFDFNSSSQIPSTIPQSQQIPSSPTSTIPFIPSSNNLTATSYSLNNSTGKMKFQS
jgi:hypothetical protein